MPNPFWTWACERGQIMSWLAFPLSIRSVVESKAKETDVGRHSGASASNYFFMIWFGIKIDSSIPYMKDDG
jgi:hypothetical protein